MICYKQYIDTIRPAVCSLMLVFSVAPAFADTFPVSVKDDRDKTVIFEQEPRSVASVSAFGADLLTALDGKADGISTLNHRPPAYLGDQLKSMKDLGEVHETNMELLTELKPDLTIGIRTYTEPFESQFEKIGKFLAFDLITYEDSERAINVAATALGETNKAAQLNAEFATNLQAHHEKAPGGLNAVFLWHWEEAMYGYFDHYFTVDMIRKLKVENSVGAFPLTTMKNDAKPISMEKVLDMNPDVILSFKGGNDPIKDHPAWHKLKALKNGRFYRVGDQYVMPHGPVARDMVLRELAYLFYPDHFPQPEDIPVAARARPVQFSNH